MKKLWSIFVFAPLGHGSEDGDIKLECIWWSVSPFLPFWVLRDPLGGVGSVGGACD